MTTAQWLKSKSSLLIGTAIEHLQSISSGVGGFIAVKSIDVDVESNDFTVNTNEEHIELNMVDEVDVIDEIIEIEEVENETYTI